MRLGSKIMTAIVPVLLEIMEDDMEENPDSGVWGLISYPHVDDRDRVL